MNMKYIWYLLCRYILVILSDKHFTKLIRRIQFVRLGIPFYPLMKKGGPKTFSQYLLEMKLRDAEPLHTLVADKISVRRYIQDCIGGDYLIPSLGDYKELSHDVLMKLPKSFIIKANHGSGWNFIKKEGDVIDSMFVIRLINKWLGMNAYYLSRESQYRSIEPGIIIEQLIGENPMDYKIFCFRGKPKCIQVDANRFSNHQRSFYDLDWRELEIELRYPRIENQPSKPNELRELIKVAEHISKDFEFCRVDLYYESDKIYFGELTLNPGGGVEPFLNYSQDAEMYKIITD